ncbi:hypothetical protein [Yoonia sp.]|uniref:hypothetical protein n=1 Tax=Yoonia sp. TaxID=2212373 RepID=UPI0035C818CE
MTPANIIMGILIAGGFFVSAMIGRLFRKTTTGIIIGGVAGIAVSVVVLIYGLNNVFDFAAIPVDS